MCSHIRDENVHRDKMKLKKKKNDRDVVAKGSSHISEAGRDAGSLEDKHLLTLEAGSRNRKKDFSVRSPKTKPVIPCTFTRAAKHCLLFVLAV